MTNPRPGDYGLVPVHGTAGKLIRIGQYLNGDGFADYEHAFVYIGDGKVIQAEPSGAKTGKLSQHSHVYWSSDKIALTGAQRAAIVLAAQSYIGTPYSFADYFALAAHRLHIPAPHLRAYIQDSRHLICSQLVDQCYQDAGVHLFADNRWDGYVTPEDLYNILQHLCYAKVHGPTVSELD